MQPTEYGEDQHDEEKKYQHFKDRRKTFQNLTHKPAHFTQQTR